MKVVICIFLVIATFTVYSQVQSHEFLNFDDRGYITENENIKSGLNRESVIWAFTSSYFANWHPITWLSHILDYQLYGSNPKGHHLANLFFHIINSLVLFLVFLRMTGALWKSGFVAAMFALHPFNVESVAWIAERKNVLSTLFCLLTIRAYIHYIERPSFKRYSFMVLMFTLGLMSKPMLVTLPFVLLLIDFWPLKRLNLKDNKTIKVTTKYANKGSIILRLVFEKIPLFFLAMVSSIATYLILKSENMIETVEAYSIPARFINAMVSYLEYLKKAFWPKDLAIFYPHPANDFNLLKGLLCCIVLVGITTISVRFIKKAPYFAVGWFWYLGTLVPVIGIVQNGHQAMADRYAYIPLIGIFIIIAWGLPGLVAKWRYKKKILSVSVGVLIPFLMVVTWVQVTYWKDSIAVFKRAVKVNDKKYPSLAIVHNNLGIALSADRRYKEAIFHHRMAIKLNPSSPLKHQTLFTATAHYNLGNAFFAEQKMEEAIPNYRSAIKLIPEFIEAYINFGNALMAQKRVEEAILKYKVAIKLNPNYALSHNNLGYALAEKGSIDEAIFHYKMAIKLNPSYSDAHKNLKTAEKNLKN